MATGLGAEVLEYAGQFQYDKVTIITSSGAKFPIESGNIISLHSVSYTHLTLPTILLV